MTNCADSAISPKRSESEQKRVGFVSPSLSSLRQDVKGKTHAIFNKWAFEEEKSFDVASFLSKLLVMLFGALKLRLRSEEN